MDTLLRQLWEKRVRVSPVVFCPEWRRNYAAFEHEMGPRPSAAHTPARIDVLRPYEPGNCRWAEPKERVARTPIPRKQLTPDQLSLLLDAVASGVAIADIAEAFNMSTGGVRNILARRGIRARQQRSASDARYAVKITAEDALAIRTRRAAGEKVKDLANAYGLSPRATYYLLRGKTWRNDPLA